MSTIVEPIQRTDINKALIEIGKAYPEQSDNLNMIRAYLSNLESSLTVMRAICQCKNDWDAAEHQVEADLRAKDFKTFDSMEDFVADLEA